MKSRKFGPLGRQVPVVGQGTWNMERSPAESVRALRSGIDLGLTHIDTAEMYGAGRVEELVAQAIEGRRQEVFLVSKVLPSTATYEGTLRACEQSLRRLKTDTLDLYLLHWPSSHPLADTIRAFDALVREGKIRAYGVSNFDVDGLEEAQRLAPGKIVCDQVLYHLGARHIEVGVLPWCRKHQEALVAYSPFGSGSFPQPGTKGRQVLDRIGRGHRVSAFEVALAFLLLHEVFVIPKSSTEEHVRQNAHAASVTLLPQEVEQIDSAFPRPARVRSLPMI